MDIYPPPRVFGDKIDMSDTNNWKPEVGKTAWIVWASTFQFCEIRQVVIDKELGAMYFDVSSTMNGGFYGTKHIDSIYPTIAKAQESFEVYDLEGKEVVVTRDWSEIDLLASEGRILSPFELEFYNFCKKDDSMVAKFATSLIHPKSAESGESPKEEDNRDGSYTN